MTSQSFAARVAMMEEAIASCALEGIKTDKSALQLVIENDLREQGVRNYESLAAEIVRKGREG